MALLAYQQIQVTGAAVVLSAVSASDTVPPDDRGFYEVLNGSGAPVNVTVVVPGLTYGQANPDIVVAVPAGATRRFGPLVPGLADPATRKITILHSATATVTGAAVRI